jgi:hypothetical protein
VESASRIAEAIDGSKARSQTLLDEREQARRGPSKPSQTALARRLISLG